MMRRFGVLFAVSVLIFASCAQEPEEQVTPAEPSAIALTASDYTYQGPASAQSGAVAITLTNSGKEPHQAQLFKLSDGVEIGQLVEEGKKPEGERDFSKLGTWEGGPNAVDAGETQVATVELDGGNYTFFCQVPDAKGTAHLALGMVAPLSVTDAEDPADVPSAELSSSAKEFDFTLPSSWDGTVSFQNNGEQAHELQVIGVAEGKTPEDVEAWFRAEPGQAGPPSWTTGGGVAVVEPGATDTFEAGLQPGTYFAMCFVGDPESKKPHFALGMMKRFEVK